LEIFWKHLWKIVGKILEIFEKFLKNSWNFWKILENYPNFSKILEKLSRFSKNSWKIIEIFGKFLKIIQIYQKLLKFAKFSKNSWKINEIFRKFLKNYRKSLSKKTEFSIIGWGSPPPRSGHPWFHKPYIFPTTITSCSSG
jgi:DNA mismatch repair ATPase MutS